MNLFHEGYPRLLASQAHGLLYHYAVAVALQIKQMLSEDSNKGIQYHTRPPACPHLSTLLPAGVGLVKEFNR